jgi:hypothetical protein
MEQDRRAVIGLQDAAELGLERAVDATTREVRGAVRAESRPSARPSAIRKLRPSVPDSPSRVTFHDSGVVNVTR